MAIILTIEFVVPSADTMVDEALRAKVWTELPLRNPQTTLSADNARDTWQRQTMVELPTRRHYLRVVIGCRDEGRNVPLAQSRRGKFFCVLNRHHVSTKDLPGAT